MPRYRHRVGIAHRRLPDRMPVAVVSDDPTLASEAASQGASQLGIGQLLDLFIAQ
ncbi:MAG: hypothetical protein R2706_18405 [Acidimicrobiales bacterium]